MTPFAGTTAPASAVAMPAGSTAFRTAARTLGSARGPDAVLASTTRFWNEGVSVIWTSWLVRRLSISCGVRRSTNWTSPFRSSCAAVVASGTTR